MRISNFLEAFGMRAVFCTIATLASFQSYAQVLLFDDTPTLPSTLTENQVSIYNELTASNQYDELRFIQFNSLATVEEEGDVSVNIVGNTCGDSSFGL
jgi:hypothetical protein